MFKIKLSYLTSSGCDWLEEVVNISPNNYKQVIKFYYNKNEPVAQRLVDKWNGNGEDVTMGIDFDNIDAPRELYKKIYKFIDELD